MKIKVSLPKIIKKTTSGVSIPMRRKESVKKVDEVKDFQ